MTQHNVLTIRYKPTLLLPTSISKPHAPQHHTYHRLLRWLTIITALALIASFMVSSNDTTPRLPATHELSVRTDDVVDIHRVLQTTVPLKTIQTPEFLCQTEVSPQFQQSLSQWLTTVQQPYVLTGASSSGGEVVYYVDPNVWNGGYIDRQRGVMSMLMLAITLNRPFALDWNTPAPLQNSLSPSLINYTRMSERYQQRREVIQRTWIDSGYDQFDGLVDQMIASPESPVIVDANLFLLNHLRAKLNEQTVSIGILHDVQFWSMYTCLYATMYKLHVTTEELIQASLAQAQPPMQLKDQTNVVLLTNSTGKNADVVQPVHLMCLQYRHGNSPEFADSQSLASEAGLHSAVDVLLADMDVFLNNTRATQHIAVFITSDSATALPLMQNKLSTQPFYSNHSSRISTFSLLGNSVHISRPGVVDGESGQRKAVADNWMLGLCDNAIVTRTGFGISGLARTGRVGQMRLLNTGRNPTEANELIPLNRSMIYEWAG